MGNEMSYISGEIVFSMLFQIGALPSCSLTVQRSTDWLNVEVYGKRDVQTQWVSEQAMLAYDRSPNVYIDSSGKV